MEKKTFVLGVAGVEAIVFSIIIYMAVTATVLFRPLFGAGESFAVASFVKPIMVMVVAGLVHHWTQRYLNDNRPGVVSAGIVAFDYVTSFLPAVTLAIAFFWMRSAAPVQGYESWWNWTQGLYAIIVFWAICDDIVPTIRFASNGRK